VLTLPSYACGIAQVVAWGGEATVRAVAAPLTLEEALAQLAQRHAGEIGRVLRLPTALPEPGSVLKDSDPAALTRSPWQAKRHVAARDGRRQRDPARGEDRE
jgi:hypothetical protein